MRRFDHEQPEALVSHTTTTMYVPLIGALDGERAVVDRADAGLVAGFFWFVHRNGNVTYARAQHRKLDILMHRLVAGAGADESVDHWNLDGLDNRRANLRVATKSQNGANRGKQQPRKNSAAYSSRYKGVYWHSSRSQWKAQLHTRDRCIHLGRFESEEAAAHAYDEAALGLWGEFARLNFPE